MSGIQWSNWCKERDMIANDGDVDLVEQVIHKGAKLALLVVVALGNHILHAIPLQKSFKL